jgi:hypothetical protein
MHPSVPDHHPGSPPYAGISKLVKEAFGFLDEVIAATDVCRVLPSGAKVPLLGSIAPEDRRVAELFTLLAY